jgi:hypothetical protein
VSHDIEPLALGKYLKDDEARARQEQVDWVSYWELMRVRSDSELASLLDEAVNDMACNDPLVPLLCQAADRLRGGARP